MLGRSRADSCQMIGCTAICRLATSTSKGIGCCPGPRNSARLEQGPAHPVQRKGTYSTSNGWVPFLQLHQNPI